MEYGTYGKEIVDVARKEAACLANRITASFGYSPQDKEDIEQSLVLTVLEKMGAYNPSKGAISTFVCTVMRGEVLHELRRRRSDKWIREIPCLHDATFNGECVVPYHETLDHATYMECMHGQEADPIRMADLCQDVAAVLKRLTPRQRDISQLLMEADKATAARQAGISRQTLYREIKAIREVMTESGLHLYLQTL